VSSCALAGAAISMPAASAPAENSFAIADKSPLIRKNLRTELHGNSQRNDRASSERELRQAGFSGFYYWLTHASG
jgi:hypothetical protein